MASRSYGIDFNEERKRQAMMSLARDNYENTGGKMLETVQRFEGNIKKLFKHDPELKIYRIGSFFAGIDIDTSDVDFTIRIPSLKKEVIKEHRYGSLNDCEIAWRVLWKVVNKVYETNEYRDLTVIPGRNPVLHALDRRTGIRLDASYGGLDAVRNSNYLRWHVKVFPLFQPLCRAVKRWAQVATIEGAAFGRLNNLSICYLVVHYLQWKGVVSFRAFQNRVPHCQIAPVRHPRLRDMFFEFFQYFADFDFTRYYISLKNGCAIRRAPGQQFDANFRDNSFQYIVVEDPFKDPSFNCAGHVRREFVYQDIRLKFREALDMLRKPEGIIELAYHVDFLETGLTQRRDDRRYLKRELEKEEEWERRNFPLYRKKWF